MEGMNERTRCRGGVYGGVLSLCSGWQIEGQQKYRSNIQHGLRWLPFNILQATTDQKHAGMTERGWDRTRNWAWTLGECNSIVLGLLSAPKRDPSKYAKEGNMANDNDNDKYAVGKNGNNEPLAKGNDDNNTSIAATADNNEPLANDVEDKYAKGDDNDKYANGKDNNGMPGATTMTSMLRATMKISTPRAMMMTNPLMPITTTSMPRRATLPRATAMKSPLLRVKRTTSTLRATTTTNIIKQQPTKNMQA
jgi:hypothetical protein